MKLRTALILLALFLASAVGAQGYWQSRLQVSVGSAPAYTGPGDVVSGAVFWFGLRAYSSADRGNALINVCNVADVACADMSSDATTGALSVTTIGGSSCSIVTCTIKTWYNRGSAGGSVTQATIAQRPTLIVSCTSGLPCAAFATVNGLSGASATIARPYSMNVAAIRTGAFTTFASAISADNGASNYAAMAWKGQINSAGISSVSTGLFATVADSAWGVWTGQFLTSPGPSVVNVVGSSTSINITPNAIANTDTLRIGNDGFASKCTCQIAEAGIWPVGFTGTQAADLLTNQTNWGY